MPMVTARRCARLILALVGVLTLVYGLASLREPGAIQTIDEPRYRIAYLLAEGASPPATMRAQRITHALGATVVTSPVALGAMQAGTPPDALILHPSALTWVEPAWLAAHYPRGMILVGFNVWVDDLAALAQDPCLLQEPLGATPPFGDAPYYVIVSLRVEGNQAGDVTRLIQARRQGRCRAVPGIGASAGVQSGFMNSELSTDEQFEQFATILLQYLRARHESLHDR